MMGLRVAAALVRFEVENMALDHTGIPLDFDFPALLAVKSGLIPVLREKQPHFISGAAVGAGTVSYTHLDVYKRQGLSSHGCHNPKILHNGYCA